MKTPVVAESVQQLIEKWREDAGREGLKGQQARHLQAWEVFDRCADELETLLALRPASQPRMELDNHHNALKCPYCNPKGLKLAEPEVEGVAPLP